MGSRSSDAAPCEACEVPVSRAPDRQTDEPPRAPEGVPLAAVIVAGGRSSRMGRDKASLVLRGRTLLDRTLAALGQLPDLAEVVLVLAPEQAAPAFTSAAPVTIVRDRVEGAGPLPAIALGLGAIDGSARRVEVALVLGCDTPFVRPALLALLARAARAHAVVLPVHDGRPQPLCAAVRLEALPALEALLAAGKRAATVLADLPGALQLAPAEWAAADPDGVSFLGVNTPEELARAEAVAGRLDAGERAR